MDIDLTRLNSGIDDTLIINENINIPKESYQNTSIIELKDLKIDGKVFKNSAGITTIQALITGTMVLEDAISLEPIDYQFSSEIDEELSEYEKKLENILDITDILWQNIMLEVPLKISHVEDFNEYQGDGWKLVSEDSIKNTNNPFNELKDMMGEE
jgi:uncharacterized protein